MESEWIEKTLADISSDVSYGYTESATTQPIGPKFLRITDIQGGVVDWNNVPHCPISQDDHQKYSLRAGDIVVARTGNSTGENYLFLGNADAVYASYLIRFRLEQSQVDPRFVWYNLRTPRWWSFIDSSKTGSAQAGANAKILGRFSLKLPPLCEQRAIACILGALDDKIELNRRRNETLEGMARALFQSWFVDFDPVRAKSSGLSPHGLNPELATFFPGSFEESLIGQIPKGWLVQTIGDVADINSWTLGKKDTLEEIDYIEISEVMRGEVGTISRYHRGNEPGRAKRRLRHGDTAISTVRPDRGAYFLALNPPPSLVASTGFAVMTPKDGQWAFVHLLTTRSEFGEELGRLADGGAYPAVRPEVISVQPVVMPSNKGILDGFEKIVQAMFLSSESLRRESKILSAVRDTILPKLVTGELRVSNAEAIVGRLI